MAQQNTDQIPRDDSRSRWLNTSYSNSTIYHEQGKQWAEMDNKTQKIKWNFYEVGRTSDYIELLNTTRKDTVRLFPNRMDAEEDGGWTWVSNGHWSK